MLCIFLFTATFLCAQNILEKQITVGGIDRIVINGNQIFNISVSTSKTDKIKILSTLDGEYQNEFQILSSLDNHTLTLGLEHLSFLEIPDDKRNAHKVIAATLRMEIPEDLSLQILSDIGSVDMKGDFKSLYIELLQGRCDVEGTSKTATINTLDGDISVVTTSASVEASSNRGKVTVDNFYDEFSIWKLKSINGNITVVKPD